MLMEKPLDYLLLYIYIYMYIYVYTYNKVLQPMWQNDF